MDNYIVLTELREISPLLAEIKNVEIYSVPTSYFESLHEQIIKKISEVNELAFNFSPATPYKIEDRYFDNLADSVLKKIRNEREYSNEIIDELSTVAPLLNTINKSPLFSVPAPYFENFSETIESREKPKVKSLKASQQITRYAVAAVITALMAVGVYVIIGKNVRRSEAQAVNVKSAIQSLRDEEIIEFLRMHSSRNNSRNVSQNNSPANKFHETLKQMTDEEIQQYLQENSEAGELEVDI